MTHRIALLTLVAIMGIAALEVQPVYSMENADESSAQKPLDAHERLLRACEQGDLAGAKEALKAGANPDYKDTFGNFPLHKACSHYRHQNERLAIIELLLNAGADINANNAIHEEAEHTTALHRACRTGIINFVQILLAHGADATALDSTGKTALHYDCIYGASNPDMINAVLKKLESTLTPENVIAQINLKDRYDGNTPLHYACCASTGNRISLGAMRLLLAYDGININAINNYDGQTPLHRVCSRATNETPLDMKKINRAVLLLLNKPGIDLSIKDHEQITALEYYAELFEEEPDYASWTCEDWKKYVEAQPGMQPSPATQTSLAGSLINSIGSMTSSFWSK